MSILISCAVSLSLMGCGDDNPVDSANSSVPHEGRWGIYALDLSSQKTDLLFSSDSEIVDIDLSGSGDRIAFSIKTQSNVLIDTTSEIYTLNLATGVATRLTDNDCFDSYPSFSPDDSHIVFLSKRSTDLDLYVMASDGQNQHLLYDSGGHDADVDWGGAGRIVFTRNYQIWSLDSSGADPRRETDPPGAGTTGIANLPIGDYDPRVSPDGGKIAFERLVNVDFAHGGYDIYVADMNGDNETSLTATGNEGYAQGFPNWSHSGDRLVYIVSAILNDGKYDLYMMNADGSSNHSIMPDYYTALFLCRNAVFSLNDSRIYFIGQWWN